MGVLSHYVQRMTHRSPVLAIIFALPFLAACQQLPGFGRGAQPDTGDVAVHAPDSETARPETRPSETLVGSLGQTGLRPEALDQTSAEERAAALAPSGASAQLLGETLAALGSPTQSGLWLKTGLVTTERRGRVEVKDGGASLGVELRPSGAEPGSGSQLSLSAFNSLGLSLTQLVRLRVYAE